jgi:hypothetical protein
MTRLITTGVVVGIFLIGALTLWQRVSNQVQGLVDASGSTARNVKTVDVLNVNRADFDYYVPGSSDAWKFDQKSAAYDQVSKIVKYNVHLNYSGASIAVTQQRLPDQLKPRGSDKFINFIDSANPSRSQGTGKGTLYFMATLQNGAPASGSDTVIFATDDVLMFARAGTVVGYDTWSKLIATMHPH